MILISVGDDYSYMGGACSNLCSLRFEFGLQKASCRDSSTQEEHGAIDSDLAVEPKSLLVP